MNNLPALQEAVIEGRVADSEALARNCLAEGLGPLDIFEQGLIPAMDVVGAKMRANEYYIPEVMMAARAMKVASNLIKPLLLSTQSLGGRGTVVAGTVEGDLHDIGLGLVVTMLEAAGFQVVFLGTNVAAGRFVDAVREHSAQIVALSALLTTTMLRMPAVIQALESAGLRESVKIMVGGAPVTAAFAGEIGADGWSADSVGAAELARGWVTAS